MSRHLQVKCCQVIPLGTPYSVSRTYVEFLFFKKFFLSHTHSHKYFLSCSAMLLVYHNYCSVAFPAVSTTATDHSSRLSPKTGHTPFQSTLSSLPLRALIYVHVPRYSSQSIASLSKSTMPISILHSKSLCHCFFLSILLFILAIFHGPPPTVYQSSPTITDTNLFFSVNGTKFPNRLTV